MEGRREEEREGEEEERGREEDRDFAEVALLGRAKISACGGYLF